MKIKIGSTIQNNDPYPGEQPKKVLGEMYNNKTHWLCSDGQILDKGDADRSFHVIDGGRHTDDIPFLSLGYSDYMNPEKRMMHPDNNTVRNSWQLAGLENTGVLNNQD